MEMTRERLLPWGIAFVVGLLIGWLVIGWWLLPVRWTNTDPTDLRPSARQQYLDMVAESFETTHDLARAKFRLLGWTHEETGRLILSQADTYMQEGLTVEAQRLQNLSLALGLEAPTGEQPPVESPTAGETESAPVAGSRSNLLVICGLALLIPILLIGAGYLYFLWRQRNAGVAETVRDGYEAVGVYTESTEGEQAAEIATPASHPPISPQEFLATYQLSDADYDQSFTIEDESGNYRGECGVGVAEKADASGGNAASALEVWLFDKSDIRTVTKVLMTDHAYGDTATRSKVATKGDPILAMPGQTFILETKSLVAAAEVTELEYANIEPPRSGLANLTVKIRVREKGNGR